MTDIKKRIRIVLVNPDESGNIGAVCRSMKTMGIEKLVIAGDRVHDRRVIEYMSVHAFDIYEKAVYVPTLQEALEGVVLSVGTSRREGKKRKYRTFLPEEMCERFCHTQEGEIAVVFGNEQHGLTDRELSLCNAVIAIPTSDEFPSLNLSHAVQIICYHIFRESQKLPPVHAFTPVSVKEIEEVSENLIENFRSIGFFKIDGSEEMKIFFRDIFTRAMLCKEEAAKIDRIFSKVAGIKRKNENIT